MQLELLFCLAYTCVVASVTVTSTCGVDVGGRVQDTLGKRRDLQCGGQCSNNERNRRQLGLGGVTRARRSGECT